MSAWEMYIIIIVNRRRKRKKRILTLQPPDVSHPCHESAVRRVEAVAAVSRLASEVILSAALQTKTNRKEVEGTSGFQSSGAV